MDHPRSGWRGSWVSWVACAVWLAPAAAWADIHDTKPRNLPAGLVRNAPASAEPASDEIDPGGQVEIPLKANGVGVKSVEFEFATQPRHGQLTGFHLTSRNTAVVTYVHDAASGPGRDRFTYQVRAAGTAMSGPVAVDITIRESTPQVALSPAELDFGAVNVGETSRARVTLRNEGGGVATGQLDPPEPWAVEGAADFRLGPGETRSFRLVFKPRNGRSYVETIRVGDAGIGPQRSVGLRLIGTGLGEPGRKFAGIDGVPPVSVEPAAGNPDPRKNAAGVGAAGATPPVAARVETTVGIPPGGGPGATTEAETTRAAGTASGTGFEPPPVVLNEAGVDGLLARGHGRTQLEIAWKEPQPKPDKYRLELRYLSLDADDNLRVSWQPYAKVEYQWKDGLMTAKVRDLPAGTNQSVRVVAIDGGGRFAAPSRMLEVSLDQPVRWWRLSLLQWLLIALIICGGLLLRRRIENRHILEQIDEDRRARRKAEG